jgi:uncharacterized repeat protein (TIGR01451 family)
VSTCTFLRSCFQELLQTLVVGLVLLGLFTSMVWEPVWAADSASATPPASASNATNAPGRAHEASKPVPRTDLPDVPRPQQSGQATPAPNLSAANHLLQRESPVFIENRGQFDSRVKFLVKGNGANLWLTNEGIVFDFQRPQEKQSPGATEKRREAPKPSARGRESFDPRLKTDQPPMERLVFKQKLVSANPNPTIEAHDPQPGIYNYFIGSDPDKWRTHVLAYKEVVYHDIWKGVDLKLFANGSNLEEEFIVHPGADPSRVQLAYEGIEGLSVADDGSLQVATAFGDMLETSPRMYQEIAGKSVPLSGDFKVGAQNSYSFEVAKHDQQSDLIIDPTVMYSDPRPGKKSGQGNLLYSSFLGGSQSDTGNAIAVDSSGNTYVTGQTNSTDFPTTPGVWQTSGGGVFVTKVNPLGSAPLIYSTYLGQQGYGQGIAVDSSGDAYVAGGSGGNNFPTTSNAYHGCDGEGFFTKLTPAGDALIYSTCLPGTSSFSGVAIDAGGMAYVTGQAFYGGSLPTTPNAFQSQFKGCGGYGNAFFSVFDPSASGAASLTYSTYLGATGIYCNFVTWGDAGQAVAVDAYGMAYVTGWTSGPDFPVTAGAYLTTFPAGGCSDACQLYGNLPSAFIAKFNPRGFGAASLIYSTFLGGSRGTTGNGIAVDPLGNAYVTGVTGDEYGYSGGNTPFPTTPGAFQTVADYYDAFATKLNAAGNGLVYSTLLGGGVNGSGCSGEPNFGTAVALDASNDAYVTGWTCGPAFPTTQDAFQPTWPGPYSEGFVTKFNSNGTGLIYSSYLGGTRQESRGYGIAVDQVGDAYVTGRTYAPDFPVTSFAFQPLYAGQEDAFVTSFPIGSTIAISITGIVPSAGGNAGSVSPEIVGSGFYPGATAQLNCGGSPVMGQNVTISAGGRILNTTFNLTTTAPGTCNVVVTNPDQTSARLARGFTVQQGGAPNIQVQKIGTLAITHPDGAPTTVTYVIAVSNSGNIDATGSAVSEVLDSELSLTSVSPPTATDIATANAEHYVLWLSPPIAPEATLEFVYSVIVDPSYPVGSPVVGGPACYIPPVAFYAFLTCMVNELIQGNNPNCLGAVAFCGLAATVCPPPPNPAYNPWLCGIAVKECFSKCIQCWPTIQSCGQQAYNKCVIFTQLLLGGASDPNYLAGPPGVGSQNWISGSTGLPYVISFGNDPMAGAAAQQVVVTQPLDPNIDVSTLSLTFATVPNLTNPAILVTIPPGSFNPALGIDEYMTNVDLRPVQSLFVTLDATFNPSTNTITWSFNSIDPTTGLPPTDPRIGMLPPGEGAAVSFAAKARQALPTGTQISDQAAVVFNTNPPVNTNTWVNTLDNTPPVSQVSALSGTELCSNFNVQWSGNDIGSGIANFTIYASDNGAPFAAWLTNTTSTSAVFNGQVGHSYGFYSIAQDLVGNIEPGKSAAEASTRVLKNTGCGPIGPPTVLGGRRD